MPRKKKESSSTEVAKEPTYSFEINGNKVEIPCREAEELYDKGELFQRIDYLADGKKYKSYHPMVGWLICSNIRSGWSLRELCKEDWCPSRMTIHRWLAEDEEFRKQFELARRMWAENEFERMIAIADNVNPIDNAVVNKARLRIDTRKWVVSKMLPKKYGKEGLGYEERDPKEILQEMMKHLPDNLRSAVLELNQVRLHLGDVTTTRVRRVI